MVGGLAAQAVDQGRVAAGFQLALQTADVAGTLAEQASGLRLSSLPLQDSVHDLEDIAFFLAHGNPVLGWYDDRHNSSLAKSRRTVLSPSGRTFLLR